MSRVFISNTKVQETESDIVFNPTIGIEQFPLVEKDGDTIFIIDVHCSFSGAKEMQKEGGVVIYRHLLKQFEKCQDKLKVIFYSPIPQDDLVKLKPENYVLKFLPFVELFPEAEQYLIKPEEWTFDKALTEVEKEDFPQFNNASENLLSGWALYKANNEIGATEFVESYYRTKEEIKQSKKGIARSIAFIDDQMEEWQTTYKQIFETDSNLLFLNYKRDATTTNGFDEDKIVELNKIKDADLIVSDFYLEENHIANHWMNEDELFNKSGFKLYQTIKGQKRENGINKAIPYIMHTSSNKIQYFKFLNSHGIDDWLVKDGRYINITTQEKQTTFQEFKNVIEEFTSNKNSELYVTLNKFWQRILYIENSPNDNWAFTKKNKSVKVEVEYQIKDYYDKKNRKWIFKPNIEIIYNANSVSRKEVIELLKDSWIALRTFITKQKSFSESIGSKDKSFTASSICTNLGKLFEFFQFNQKMDFNMVFRYIFSIRNAASHYSDYLYFSIDDCLIYFDLWLSILEENEIDLLKFFEKKDKDERLHQDKGGGKSETFVYRLLYSHIQFYNSAYSDNYPNIKNALLNRIEKMFGSLVRLELIDETNSSDKLKKAICNYDETQKLSNKIKLDTTSSHGKVYIVNA